MKMFVQFRTKNFALEGDQVELETHLVPRVGELIRTSQPGHGLEPGTFIVESVVWELKAEGFVPCLTARRWYRGLRHELLEERGWLTPPDGVETAYDEDSPAHVP